MRPAELLNRQTAIYLLEHDTVRTFTIFLLVGALSASSLSILHCQWVCARAAGTDAETAHCHGDGNSAGAQIGAASHTCDHATPTLIAVKASGLSGQVAPSAATLPASLPLRFAVAIPQRAATDAGPPGVWPSASPGSILPLRI